MQLRWIGLKCLPEGMHMVFPEKIRDFTVRLGYPFCGVYGWQGMGWGGGLILSKAQKSAATPIHPLLGNDV
jgi:hypothetical protein